MGHNHRYKFGFRKKNQVKSSSIWSRTPNSVRIRQSGRTRNRGVTPSPGDPEAEALSREQALRASSVPSTSTSGGSSSALLVPGPEVGSVCPARLPLPRKRIDPTPRVLTIKKKRTTQGKSAGGAQVKDFIPWLRSEPSQPSLSEE